MRPRSIDENDSQFIASRCLSHLTGRMFDQIFQHLNDRLYQSTTIIGSAVCLFYILFFLFILVTFVLLVNQAIIVIS